MPQSSTANFLPTCGKMIVAVSSFSFSCVEEIGGPRTAVEGVRLLSWMPLKSKSHCVFQKRLGPVNSRRALPFLLCVHPSLFERGLNRVEDLCWLDLHQRRKMLGCMWYAWKKEGGAAGLGLRSCFSRSRAQISVPCISPYCFPY